MKKETMNLNENMEEYTGEFEERKRKGKMLWLKYNVKNQKLNKKQKVGQAEEKMGKNQHAPWKTE